MAPSSPPPLAAAAGAPGDESAPSRRKLKGPVLRSLPLHGSECLALLRAIIVDSAATASAPTPRRPAAAAAPPPRAGGGGGRGNDPAPSTQASARDSPPPINAGGGASLDDGGEDEGGPSGGGGGEVNSGGEGADAAGAARQGKDSRAGRSASSSRDGGSSDDDNSSSSSSSSQSQSQDDSDSHSGEDDGDDASNASASSSGKAVEALPAAPDVRKTINDDVPAAAAAAAKGGAFKGGSSSSNVVKTKKRRERQLKVQSEQRRHVEEIPCHHFRVPREAAATARCGVHLDDEEGGGGPSAVLCVPDCVTPDRNARDDLARLLSRRYDESSSSSSEDPLLREARALVSLLEQPTQSQSKGGMGGMGGLVVVMWWMRSGRLAAGVFVNDSCVAHSTKARYTVRKGQGKSQSAMDSQKGKNAKSVGAQLRRAGQVQLWEDARSVALSWTEHFQRAHLVFVMVPAGMNGTLWKETFASLLAKDDPRVRTRVPLNLKKPTFESLAMVHRVLTTCTIRRSVPDSAAVRIVPETPQAAVRAKESTRQEPAKTSDPDAPAESWPPWTALHEAAAKGRVEALVALLGQEVVNVNAPAGPLLQTPLHVAAAAGSADAVEGAPTGSSNAEDVDEVTSGMKALSAEGATISADVTAAAECVYQLLVKGGADPAATDIRNRVPYFLASNDSVRVAFRRARAVLEGGDSPAVAWDWDAAKVGPALADEDLEARREREAEKKRQKKQRQKERKAKDKAAAEAQERQRQQHAEEQRKQEEAKRIRDGLQPKANTKATNVCDYCQKVCVGKRRRDMYQRLEYAYCSPECVQLHKRELMAAAAMARFQSPA